MEFILALIVAGGIGYWTYTRLNSQIEKNHSEPAATPPEPAATPPEPAAESAVESATEQPAAKPKKSSGRKAKPKAE